MPIEVNRLFWEVEFLFRTSLGVFRLLESLSWACLSLLFREREDQSSVIIKNTGRSQHGGKLQNVLLSIHIQIALALSQMAYYYLEHAAVRHNNCREETESLTGTWRKIFLADFIKSVLQPHSSRWDHNVLMSAQPMISHLTSLLPAPDLLYITLTRWAE